MTQGKVPFFHSSINGAADYNGDRLVDKHITIVPFKCAACVSRTQGHNSVSVLGRTGVLRIDSVAESAIQCARASQKSPQALWSEVHGLS
jgi:hypothetical protein